MQQGSRPILPESIARKLEARYGKTEEAGPTGSGGGDSLAGRVAARRQQRSAERSAVAAAALMVEDSREGPPAWHGLGLRNDHTNPQRMWQEQMQQQRQKQMEMQMQREQDALQQRVLAQERKQLERQKARAEARSRSVCATSANPKSVQSNLKVQGASALQPGGLQY